MKFAKLLVAAAMTAAAGAAQAQQQTVNCGGLGEQSLVSGSSTCIVNNTVSTTVPTVARLEIDFTNTTLLAPLAADFGTAAGVNTTGPVLTVRSNSTYSVSATAHTSTWAGGANNKPAGDLKLKVGVGGTLASLSSAVPVATAAAKTAGQNYSIFYNTIYNWLVDVPDTYTLQVDYTLVAP